MGAGASMTPAQQKADAKYKSKKRAMLNETAQKLGFKSWSSLETAIYNKEIKIAIVDDGNKQQEL